MQESIDRRFVAGLFVGGAALAMLGNALHPILDPHGGPEGLIAAAAETSYWTALHLVVVVAVAVLTAATVMLLRSYAGTPGAATAQLASVFALVGGTIFTFQIGAVDGVIVPALADALAAGGDEAALLATATAVQAFDIGLLSIVNVVYFGGAFLLLGMTLHRTDTFAAWLRWTAMGAGALGIVVGALMFVGAAHTFAFYAFRVVALAVTIVAFGLGYELRRAAAPATTGSPAAPAPA